MKKLLLTFLSISMMQCIVHAETVILTVNMGELFNNYKNAKEAQDIFNADVERAQEEMREIINKGQALVKEYQDLMTKSNNPAYTDEVRHRYSEEANAKQVEVAGKEEEVSKFRSQSDQVLAARRQSMIELHLGELRAVVEEVAKEKNADLVLNSSGSGVSVVYASDSLDITSVVLARINEG